ncbi:tastin [Ranitomeya variabilis]|uniref:tastin n=1 Tax=Ranitomeya variabilis TaxID=490064 RepID=UPI004056A79B
MQSYNDGTYGFGYKSPIVQKSSGKKGKENEPNASARFQPEKQNPTLEKHWPQDLPKSRLPILSKVNQPPDFQKLHQSWQNQFQKGKAVKKKACTRPQPFNFSQKLDRPRVAPDTRPFVSPPARHRREPLAEVTFGQKNRSKDSDVKGGNAEFKADPAALASILSDVGVPVPATGKLSLAQRVPMRASSIAQSSNRCKNTMVRSSMYAVLRCQSASSNLDRISCFANMQPKVSVKKPPVFKQNSLLHVRDRKLEEPVSSSLDSKLHSQENPVLQQMNRTANVQSSSMNSPLLQSQEVTKIKSTPLHPVTEDVESSVLPADKHEKSTSERNSFAGKQDPRKKAGGAAPVDFVADSQALASILSNTGVTTGNYGKLSLAQRVPVQSKNVTVKSGMISLDFVTTPKPYYGRISAVAMPIKDIAPSPCRVAKTLTTDKPSSASAKRVPQLYPSAMKFPHQYSTSKRLFFPKTPRALALERANEKLQSELSDTQSSTRSTVKWADERSPSESLCERELKIDQVAVQLFLDGECPGEPDKTESAEESDCFKGSENLPVGAQKRKEATLPENSDGSEVAARVSQDLSVHANMHPPAPLSLANTADPPVQYHSMVSSMKTSLPLSFLSHPVVRALQSNTLGSYSLPNIARLRIQAAVSAKQRFWETCLDEECAFYTSRGADRSFRNCIDPVSSFLERQDDLHFTPIIPGDPIP